MKHWTRSIPGFFLNILKRTFLASFEAKEVKRIYNYRKVPNLFETSGQPGKQQLKLLAKKVYEVVINLCLLYTSPSPRDATLSRMPSSA